MPLSSLYRIGLLGLFSLLMACNSNDDTFTEPDTDLDGIVDKLDNCPETENPNQEDIDGDGIGDACDPQDDTDSDSDGVIDSLDNCAETPNTDQADDDNDGIGNVCDDTDDNFEGLFKCENGFAGDYPCQGLDLMAHIDTATLGGNGGVEGSDIWGWTDPSTGHEYAIIALTNSTAFVDITDISNPIFLGRLNTNTISDFWRDVKIYNNYAFIVADSVGSHGMQVFDLTRLRSSFSEPQTFTADAIYNGVGSCHNIVINESEAVAYLVGCNSASGGPIFVDISNPTSPAFLGSYPNDGYSHDAQVVTYSGPDSDYTGREIYIGSHGNNDRVVILDVTDKSNVQTISSFTYAQSGYPHQGWFTEDQRYFILGDETDELSFGFNTKTLIFDFSDLDNPTLSSTYNGPTRAIDHNGYVLGDEYYLANYRAGLRILDISNIASSSNPMTETHFFDTYPNNDIADFNGVWSVYPYFASGNIIISDIERGLLVVRKSD